jgi:hypothetical protein
MTDHEPLSSLVRDAAPTGFRPGFAERVERRIAVARQLSLTAALERQFVRIVPVAAAAAILLGAFNWWGARETSSSAIDAALNLPQVTLASAYSATSLFGTFTATADVP